MSRLLFPFCATPQQKSAGGGIFFIFFCRGERMIKSTVPAQVQTSDRPEEGGKVSLTRPDGLLIKILSIESEGGGLSCHRCRK